MSTTYKKKINRRVGIKNNVVIPIDLARMYNITPSTFVSFESSEDGIIIKPAEDPIKKAKGVLRGGNSSLDIKREIREEEKACENKKFNF